MKWQIALGTLSIAALAGLFAILALGEQGRMATFTSAYEARQVESGAALFENSCRPCHGPQGKGVPGLAPSINAADLFNGQRLASVGYAGTLEDYLRSVIAAGRPVPSAGANYPNRMPTWGQEFGGPLRSDQIDALVTFIANWEERALAEAVPTPIVGQTVGTDISVPLPAGDTAAGKALAEGPLGCAACHLLTAVGPAWLAQAGEPGIGERAGTRIGQDAYTGEATTPEQYLFESVVLPSAHIVPPFQDGLMPKDYGSRLSAQELADLIAYMLSLR